MECAREGVVYDIFSLFLKNGLEAYKFDAHSSKTWKKVDLNNWKSWTEKEGLFDVAFSKEYPSASF